MREEPFLPFRYPAATVRPTSKFRSTWLSSSVRSLKERGLLDKYLALLPREHHDVVVAPVVGVWLPVAVAEAHYDACDGLALPSREMVDIGLDVCRRVHDTILSTAVKLARGAGATPWTIYAQFQRLWDRIWIGGDVGVVKLGPKEARIEVIGWTCARSTYCRTAIRGVFQGLADMFCSKAYCHEVPALCSPSTLGFRMAWA